MTHDHGLEIVPLCCAVGRQERRTSGTCPRCWPLRVRPTLRGHRLRPLYLPGTSLAAVGHSTVQSTLGSHKCALTAALVLGCS